MMRETFTYLLYQIKLLLKVDGTNLQLNTTEPKFQFLLHALQHLLVVAHPHQSVDGDTNLTPRESIIEQLITILQIKQSRFQSKQHRWIVAHGFIVYLTSHTKHLAKLMQLRHVDIIAHSITTQVGQWCTLTHSMTLTIAQMYKPYLAG